MGWRSMNKSNLSRRVFALLLLAAAFGVVAWLVLSGILSGIESAVYAALAQLISPQMNTVMIFITSFGSAFVITAVVIVLLLVPSTRFEYGVPVAVSAIVAAILIFALKELFARPRPDILWLVTESGYSFPSGHTMSCTALFVALLLVVFRLHSKQNARLPMLIAALVIPLLVATSRVYLGVHYTGDVLGGLILGALVALLVDTVFGQARSKSGSNPAG